VFISDIVILIFPEKCVLTDLIYGIDRIHTETDMVLGIGVDMVNILEMTRLIKDLGEPFLSRTFTPGELEASFGCANRTVYLCGRFAAKEALFKALQPLTPKSIDLRRIETLNRPAGPYIVKNENLQPYLEDGNVAYIHITLADEKDYVIAFVVLER
jgi:holo-[acyl-carrier protein] synthase